MDVLAFEKLSKHPNVLVYIFKLLNYRDQLSLSCVSAALHQLFVSRITPEPYRVLNIYRRPSDVTITNGCNRNTAILNPHTLQEFLKYYARYTHELCENLPSPLVDIRRFIRLTSYSLVRRRMPPDHLMLLAQCCPTLENLEMFDVKTDISSIVNTLALMRKLKRLTLKYADFEHHIEYRYFREFVCRLRLDAFTVHSTLVPSVVYNDVYATPPQLTELNIRTSFDSDMWFNDFPSFLTNLVNLTRLTFAAPDGVDDMNLKVLSETCTKLTYLAIHHTVFVVMGSFYIPKDVTEFSLEHCTGLSWENFKEILQQPSIMKFRTLGTSYIGTFENFQISPNIESLYLEGSIYMHLFKSSYMENTTLKELTWHEDDVCYYDGGEATNVPMETCPNLETLIIKGGFVPVNSIMQLMLLKKLQITVQNTTPLIIWPYIQTLLKHPPLTELTIDYQCDDRDFLRGLTNVEAFPTSVKRLTLTSEVLEQGLHFWMDLFRKNRHLTLECHKFYATTLDVLAQIVNHSLLPETLKYIDVWGFIARKKRAVIIFG